MLKIFNRISNSAQLMTWGSYCVKLLNAAIILPIILHKFNNSEAAIWLLFLLIINLVNLIDSGFSQSFSRTISYAFAGAISINKYKQDSNQASAISPNWTLISKLFVIMRRVYGIMSIISFFLIAIIGSYVVSKPISNLSKPNDFWIAWLIIVLTAPALVFGILYTTFLNGINRINLLKKWDIVFGAIGVITTILISLIKPSIIYIIANMQFWSTMNVARNFFLVNKLFVNKEIVDFDFDLFKTIWFSSWRAGVGLLLSFGVLQFTGVLCSQYAAIGFVSSYLLALRIMSTIIEFSRAPFYSRIPELSILYSRGDKSSLLLKAKNGFFQTIWLYTILVIVLFFLAKPMLLLIKSNTVFVSANVWVIMSIAFFFERYGSLHVQLYTITNHVIWHKSNLGSSIIILLSIFVLQRYLGFLVFPVSLLLGNLFWYSWYGARHNYKEFEISILKFEFFSVILPFFLLLIFSAFAFVCSF